jgi:hypothetical protein
MEQLDMLRTEDQLDLWVKQKILGYSSRGLSQEDVKNLGGHFCHHPIPQCEGGTEGVWMFVEDHAVHGVLQSEVFQRPCIYGWESEYLDGDLHDLCKKWHSEKSKTAGEIGFRSALEKNPNKMKDMNARSFELYPDLGKRASVAAHEKHPDLAAENGRRTGPKNIKVMLGSEGCRENRKEQGRRNGGRNLREVARQKWQCLVSGRISNAGNLTKIQRSLGIDTKLRKRIDD